MIKENIAQFYAVEIIVGRWKLLRAVGTGKPTSPPGYWPKKLSAYPERKIRILQTPRLYYKSRIKKDASLDVCADCGKTPHDVKHLFACPAHSTTLIASDIWRKPVESTGNSAISGREA